MLLILIGAGFQAFSQSEYQEGYIIKLQGDTLWGYVNLAKKSLCQYKLQKSDENHLTYNPGEIRGFGLTEGRFFESRTITDINKSEITVFMECLVRGSASLYLYDGRFFALKADTAFYELVKTKDLVEKENDARLHYFENNKYIGILSYLFRDCTELNEQIQKSKLTAKDLTLLFTDYNKCGSSPYIQYQEHVPWMDTKISVYTGVMSSTLQLTVQNQAGDGPSFQSTSGMVGSTAYFSWPRGLDRFSMSLGLMYFYTNFEFAEKYDLTNGVAYSEGAIKTSEIKVPWGLHYTFSKKRFAPMIGGGVAGNMMLNNSANFSFEEEINGEVETTYFDLFQLKSFYLNYWVGIGAKYDLSKKREVLVELRYEAPADLAEYKPLNAFCSHFSLMVGIRFK